MPEAPVIPPRLSPSARHVAHRESGMAGATQQQHTEYPPGLSGVMNRSNSISEHRPSTSATAEQSLVRAHRRSPTAPEAHHSHGLSHMNGVGMNGKGKTWATGMEVLGDVDRDLGGLGPTGDAGVREREPAKETARPGSSMAVPIQVQVTGAKNFTVSVANFFQVNAYVCIDRSTVRHMAS